MIPVYILLSTPRRSHSHLDFGPMHASFNGVRLGEISAYSESADFTRAAMHALERILDGFEKVEYSLNIKNNCLDFKLTRLGTTREFSISQMLLHQHRNERKRAELIFSTIQGELTALRDQCNQELWVAADLCADHGFAIAEATLRANIYPQAKEKR